MLYNADATTLISFPCGGTEVAIPNSVTAIGQNAFSCCLKLTQIKIPGSVKEIGSGAFYDCINLTSLTLGEGLTKIGFRAFESCEGLSSLTIPNSVTEIEFQAFSRCVGLTSLTLGNSVALINTYAFGDCSALEQIISKNPVPPVIMDSTFEGVDKSACQLMVPAGTLEAYSNAENWKEFINISESEEAGVGQFISEGGEKYDVYNLQGVRVLSKASRDVIQTLPAGIYVINGKKAVIR